MNRNYRIELSAAEANALMDIGLGSWPSNEEDWDWFMPDYRALEACGLVYIDDDEIALTAEGTFAYYACQELQNRSPICVFFTQEEVDRFDALSKDEKAAYFPYAA